MTKEDTISLAREYAQKEGVDLTGLQESVRKEEHGYTFTWIPANPYLGGIEYVVYVDENGKDMDSHSNLLEKSPE